jgi:hypothetical protein
VWSKESSLRSNKRQTEEELKTYVGINTGGRKLH